MNSKSLKNIFIFYISIAIILICVFGAIFYGYYHYNIEKENFKKNIRENVNTYYTFLSSYLWQLDYENLKNLSNVIFSSNLYLCSLKITNEFNEVIFYKKKNQSSCLSQDIIKIKRNIYKDDKFIGQLEIFYSKIYLKRQLYSIIFFSISIGVLLSLAIIGIILILFKRIIDNRIRKLNENLEIIAQGNYNINFELSNIKEIDKIIKNLNLMLQEIRLREKKNYELTQKLDKIINSMPVGLFIFDEKGRYVEINDTVCELLKMKKEEILKKNVAELSPDEYNIDKGFETLNKIIKEGKHDFEWRLKTKDGEVIEVIGKGRKIILDKEIWVIVALSDITYLKRLERELIKKEKLESIGVLAGGIAHDYNNILTSVFGSLELIQIYLEKGDLIKVKNKLQTLKKSLNRAKSLTHQLLTFSKGGAPVKKQVYNLDEIIKDIVEFILSGTAIEVNFEFDKELQPVEIDVDQISSAIENIVLNAKEALNNKGKIDVKVVNSKDFVKISIKDYGPGIPLEIKDKIFEPYFSTKKNGSGLGLAIVYSIIKNHNGDIKIYSEEGKYTDFQLYLPVAKQTKEKEDKRIIDKINFQSEDKKLKILILEDEEDVQDLLIDLCKILGYDAVVTSTGEEAIEKVKEEKFDIAILDLTIKGGMGGEECIKEIRKIDSNIKAIVYTGYSDSPVIKEYKKYGFNAILKKPFSLNELREAIKNCLYS